MFTTGDILATTFFAELSSTATSCDRTTIPCAAMVRSIVFTGAWAVDDGKQAPSLSGGRKPCLDVIVNSLGLKQWVVAALLCVGDRSPKTVVTGIRSSYCVYFCVKRLYSYCFVSKTTAALAASLSLF